MKYIIGKSNVAIHLHMVLQERYDYAECLSSIGPDHITDIILVDHPLKSIDYKAVIHDIEAYGLQNVAITLLLSIKVYSLCTKNFCEADFIMDDNMKVMCNNFQNFRIVCLPNVCGFTRLTFENIEECQQFYCLDDFIDHQHEIMALEPNTVINMVSEPLHEQVHIYSIHNDYVYTKDAICQKLNFARHITSVSCSNITLACILPWSEWQFKLAGCLGSFQFVLNGDHVPWGINTMNDLMNKYKNKQIYIFHNIFANKDCNIFIDTDQFLNHFKKVVDYANQLKIPYIYFTESANTEIKTPKTHKDWEAEVKRYRARYLSILKHIVSYATTRNVCIVLDVDLDVKIESDFCKYVAKEEKNMGHDVAFIKPNGTCDVYKPGCVYFVHVENGDNSSFRKQLIDIICKVQV